MTPEEAMECGWERWVDSESRLPVVLELDDGSLLIPSSDHEGNNPGALFGVTAGPANRWLTG